MDLFKELTLIAQRPAVFARMTVADLWTDPYVSEQMLGFHLDGARAIASGTTVQIEAACAWFGRCFALGPGRKVLDLGCGPGLYTTRLAKTGAAVTGVDFSAGSLAHARSVARAESLVIDYCHADYLAWDSDERFDLVTMIMRDFCALSPPQRSSLLRKVRRLLTSGGAFVFDVDSMSALAQRRESFTIEQSTGAGFWSAEPYFVLVRSFLYPDAAVMLDKHVIIEANRRREIYNWTQFLSPEDLAAELDRADLRVAELMGSVAGAPYDPGAASFAVVARPA